MPRVNSIILGALAAALLLALPPSPARADDWENCRAGELAKLPAACTAPIEQGGLTSV